MLPALRQSSSVSWPDEYPAILGEPEDNDTWSTIALIFIDISSVCALYFPMFKIFWRSLGWLSLTWYNWTMAGLILAGLGWTIWPWITRINASDNPNDATTFRAWRVNFLVGTIVALFNLTILGYYILIYILAAVSNANALIAFGLPIGGLTFALLFRETWTHWLLMFLGLATGVLGGLLVYQNKNFWYNFDPDGRRLDVEFEYFGTDKELPPLDEEEDEDVDDAEFADDEDFW